MSRLFKKKNNSKRQGASLKESETLPSYNTPH